MSEKIDVSSTTVSGMLEGVTPGPWFCTTGRLARVLCLVRKRPVVIAGAHKFGRFGGLTAAGSAEDNARFIAWAREAVPALSARLAEVEKERDARDEQVQDILREQECACGHDKPTDVCLGHHAATMALRRLDIARAEHAEAALATARRDALDLVAEGLSAEGVEVDDDIWCRVSLRALAYEAPE